MWGDFIKFRFINKSTKKIPNPCISCVLFLPPLLLTPVCGGEGSYYGGGEGTNCGGGEGTTCGGGGSGSGEKGIWKGV